MKKAIGIELRRLNNLIAREAAKINLEFTHENVTEMHANIIDYLLESGSDGAMQKDIEQAFTIRKSTASRILKLMEKNGIIERHGVDYDARLKKIKLTDGALATHEHIRAFAEEMEQRIAEGISQSELDTFFSVLEKMQNNLKD